MRPLTDLRRWTSSGETLPWSNQVCPLEDLTVELLSPTTLSPTTSHRQRRRRPHGGGHGWRRMVQPPSARTQKRRVQNDAQVLVNTRVKSSPRIGAPCVWVPGRRRAIYSPNTGVRAWLGELGCHSNRASLRWLRGRRRPDARGPHVSEQGGIHDRESEAGEGARPVGARVRMGRVGPKWAKGCLLSLAEGANRPRYYRCFFSFIS